jgi:hypothetical protein
LWHLFVFHLTVELTRLALSKNKLKERKQQMKNKGISINSGGVKSALRAQVSALHEMM